MFVAVSSVQRDHLVSTDSSFTHRAQLALRSSFKPLVKTRPAARRVVVSCSDQDLGYNMFLHDSSTTVYGNRQILRHELGHIVLSLLLTYILLEMEKT